MTNDVTNIGIQHTKSINTITVVRFSILRFSADLELPKISLTLKKCIITEKFGKMATKFAGAKFTCSQTKFINFVAFDGDKDLANQNFNSQN